MHADLLCFPETRSNCIYYIDPFLRTEAAFVNDADSASGDMVGDRAESEY